MTRFARAKGSKSSNEKKPEEATSWLELKNAMLSKKNKQREIVEHESDVREEKVEKNVEWCSLGDEFSNSISLIKEHLGKKRKIDAANLEETINEKKLGKKLKNKQSGEGKNKKNKKNTESQELESVSVKKNLKSGKKRNAGEITNEDVPVKKKKATESVENKRESKQLKKEKKMKFEKGKNKKFDKSNKKPTSDSVIDEIIVNGEKIAVVKFQGFPITLEDAEKLKKLRNELKKEGVPRSKVESAIKLERRRAEKALSRLKKAVCFLCRGHGHIFSNCPNLKEKESTGTGICYKCGSTEHSAMECKVVRETSFQFAECFICKEQGHIARQCPDNPRGLYPNGGACRECGDVTHLRKDCPKALSKRAEEEMTVGIRSDRNLECLDEEILSMQKQKKKVKKNSAIKF